MLRDKKYTNNKSVFVLVYELLFEAPMLINGLKILIKTNKIVIKLRILARFEITINFNITTYGRRRKVNSH